MGKDKKELPKIEAYVLSFEDKKAVVTFYNRDLKADIVISMDLYEFAQWIGKNDYNIFYSDSEQNGEHIQREHAPDPSFYITDGLVTQEQVFEYLKEKGVI